LELSKGVIHKQYFIHSVYKFAVSAGVISKVYHLRPIRGLIVSGLDRLSASLAFFKTEEREKEKGKRKKVGEKERWRRVCEIYSSSAFVTSKAEWQVRCVWPVSCLCSRKFDQSHDQYFYLDNLFQKKLPFQKKHLRSRKSLFRKSDFPFGKSYTFITERMRFYLW